MSKKKRSGMSFSLGGGLRWVHESRFCDEMQLTPTAFRKLCRAIGVPMLQIHGDWLVNLHMFRIGMWAATRFGQPNFLMPGCEKIGRGRKLRKDEAVRVSREYIESNLPKLVDEVCKARIMDGIELEQRTLEESKDAARRMLNLLNPRT
jgi:hypothetical protein